MMGRTHALTGWCAGLALAPALGAGSLHEAVVFGATTAGFALLPDLDHPEARASRSLGPITGGASWALRAASSVLYRATMGPRDEQWRTGEHRHLSHTVLFAVALGFATAAATAVGGAAVVGVVVWFALLLAAGALGRWIWLVGGGAAVVWLAQAGGDVAGQLDQLAGSLGIAVTVGCFVHCLGDALTESGCPFLFPIPIRGETWYEIRPPAFLRFHTGSAFEENIVFSVFAVLGIVLVPGVWPVLTEIYTNVGNTVEALS
ncbi:metal-dependent hydrolase [Amycolatopsis thermophila]|uniref:LexA-binding, inner membrane-associated hydrolase n=1 Tax=Amycolatopsis thermophila TaxID=206084 RepID=A0ABU0ENH8_9PSEU|nr:metal-dependent hydrolase [Amycolatopsis thermophila]MDQ0376555.1 hypothetical protein [Amycolatopsis thermophila]